MAVDINPVIIKKTQEALVKYISKPIITEKLLKKPPFRFIHDVVQAIIRETGFFDGLFTNDELDPDKVKDKEAKVAFLEKLISATKLVSRDPIPVKANKIVAGVEVDKTLLLLQSIVRAIESKVDDSKAVEEVLNGKKPKSLNSKGSKAKSKELRDHNTKTIAVSNENEPISKSGRGKREGDHAKSKGEKKIRSKGKKTSSSETDPQTVVINDNDTKNATHVAVDNPLTEKGLFPGDNSGIPANPNPPCPELLEDDNQAFQHERNQLDSSQGGLLSSLEKQDNKRQIEDITTAQAVKIPHHPSSARVRLVSARPLKANVPISHPAPVIHYKPAVLGSTVDMDHQGQVFSRPSSSQRPPSARPGAPRVKERGEAGLLEKNGSTHSETPVNVITDSQTNKNEDKDSFVVVGVQDSTSHKEESSEMEFYEGELNEERHGTLVTQILEAKRDIEDNADRAWVVHQKSLEVDWESSTKQKMEGWGRDIDKLREGIQKLTRSTNPLGKLFDFLQEDVDSMQRELGMWVQTNEELSKDLKKEKILIKNSLDIYRRQLAEIESHIKSEKEAIRNLTGNVLANDKRIYIMLTRVRQAK